MLPRRQTPHHTTTAIITGHFQQKKGYAVWRESGTHDWLLIYTVAGRGRFGSINAPDTLALPGDAVLLKPATLHDYGVEPTLHHWNLLWAHFQPRPHWLDWLNLPPISPDSPGLMKLSLAHRPTRSHVHRRLTAMHALATSSSTRREDLALNALEDVLLTLDSANPLQSQARLDHRVRATMDFLCRHFNSQHQKLSLHLLAKNANLSVSRLAHLFRQQTGLTPQQFLELQRLDRAKQLLALTPSSIKEIAYHVGFQNPFYFTLRFKRYTGQSPKSFRHSRNN